MSATLRAIRPRPIEPAASLQLFARRLDAALLRPSAGRSLAANAGLRLMASAQAPGEMRRLAVASLATLTIMAAALTLAKHDWIEPAAVPQAALDVTLVTLPVATPEPAPQQPTLVPAPEPPAPAVSPTTTPSVPPLPPTPAEAPAAPHPVAPAPPAPRAKQPPRPMLPKLRQQTPQQAVPRPTDAPQAAPPASTAPAQPAAPNPGEIAAFQAGMRKAVRAALVYPPAARMAGQKGQVRVAFSYLDGQVSGVAVAIGSGLPMLDRAAVATVEAAHYPPPPPAMASRPLRLTIAVDFDPDLPE